jgi:hypothetical protein
MLGGAACVRLPVRYDWQLELCNQRYDANVQPRSGQHRAQIPDLR